MKPISLKIKGLNSFNEEQFIDFEELTSEGLFGIFGPTGSGKSTVLDGITLALYGEVARNSSNIINTNCSTLSVSYCFQISGAEVKRYEVNREFKRDKKTGNPRSGKCRVSDITDLDNPIVIAEKVGEVTSKCREIIGLDINDFTRTVVLPQGKFSEFLKLEGKSRRDMLERLFNLQEYGEELTNKLRAQILKVNTRQSELQGQMIGYEDVSLEVLKEKEEELKGSEERLSKAKADMADFEKVFKENEELWNLISELEVQKELMAKLEEKRPDIDIKKHKKERGEAAARIMPFINGYREVLKDLNETDLELKDTTKRLYNIKEQKAQNEDKWEIWNNKKLKEIPELKLKQERYKEAIEESNTIEAIKREIEILKTQVESSKAQVEGYDKEISIIEERLVKGKIITEQTEEAVEKLKVDNEYKSMVQKGMLLEEKSKSLSQRIDSYQNKLTQLEGKIKLYSDMLSITEGKKKEKEVELDEALKELKAIEDGCPGTQEDLMKLQRQMLQNVDCWSKFNSAVDEIKKHEGEYSEFLRGITNENLKHKEILGEVEKLREDLKAVQVENLAHNLRMSLAEGEICPVCGSKEHHLENIKSVNNVEEDKLAQSLNLKEEELKESEKTTATLEARAESVKKIISDLKEKVNLLGEDFKKKTPSELDAEFKSFSKCLKEYTEKREKLQEDIKKLSEEKLNLEGQINTNRELIASDLKLSSDSKKEKEECIAEYKAYEETLETLRINTNISDFTAENLEIQKKEVEKQQVEERLKNCRKLYEDLQTKREGFKKAYNESRETLLKYTSVLSEKSSNLKIKEGQLEDKFGKNVDYTKELLEVETQIVNIEKNFEELRLQKERLEEEFRLINEKFIELNTKSNQLRNRSENELKDIEGLIEKDSFESMDAVNRDFLEDHIIKALEGEIKEYETNIAKVSGAVENIKSKVNGRQLSEEQWNEFKVLKESKEEELSSLNEVRIKVTEEVLSMKRKLEELGDLIKKKEALDHRGALLNELDKLFKGKKFVEYVAIHRLKYIAGKASKELKEISSGTYGIEVDESGSFIIRDYKNGGAARDASTLSGGETFLASLALALALSNEIQLKGTAPLELFFLDEGFGTLDDELLDTVMNSLERIHNERLKIGIISHVESIKNRIPVKLIITPAEAGVSGSKVKIERN